MCPESGGGQGGFGGGYGGGYGGGGYAGGAGGKSCYVSWKFPYVSCLGETYGIDLRWCRPHLA